MTGWLGALARLAATQPIAEPVPADDAGFLERKGSAKLALRVVRRRLEIALGGQGGQERSRTEPNWARALWIHAEAPQIGDALMDLAPRSLLAERGIALDLLAPPHLCALFAGDRLFGQVFSNEAEVDAGRYDFIVVDSRSWKALAAKRRRAPGLPWVAIKGEYLGYDYQRGLFAARRLAALLGLQLGPTEANEHARQKLVLQGEAAGHAARELSMPAAEDAHCAFALGGVRRERSYAHWAGVATRLATAGVRRFTWLGSANARADRDAVATALAASAFGATGIEMHDLVDASDLHGSRRAMQAADLVLCADGGLMHLALTTATPVVALFDAGIDPAWRLPADACCTVLRSPVPDVSAIEPERVAGAALARLAAPAPPRS